MVHLPAADLQESRQSCGAVASPSHLVSQQQSLFFFFLFRFPFPHAVVDLFFYTAKLADGWNDLAQFRQFECRTWLRRMALGGAAQYDRWA